MVIGAWVLWNLSCPAVSQKSVHTKTKLRTTQLPKPCVPHNLKPGCKVQSTYSGSQIRFHLTDLKDSRAEIMQN